MFVSKSVSRLARAERISDATLFKAARDAEQGLVRANLGDEAFKVDLARPGRGKSHGYRAILGLRPEHRAHFVHLWAKNEAENIRPEYVHGLKQLIQGLMALTDEQLATALEQGILREIAPTEPGTEDEKDQDGKEAKHQS